jgi:hypothetical protein
LAISDHRRELPPVATAAFQDLPIAALQRADLVLSACSARSNRCAYTLSVVSGLTWPSCPDTKTTFCPAAISRLANVCLRSWMTRQPLADSGQQPPRGLPKLPEIDFAEPVRPETVFLIAFAGQIAHRHPLA